MALTNDQVHTAADALVKRGERPKLTAVRRELGGGSFSTISEAMQTWRAQQEKETALAQVEVPESIKERLDILTAATWEAANAEADQRIQTERAALEQAREEAAAQITDVREAMTALEADIVNRDEQIAELTTERDRYRQANEQAEQKRVKAEAAVVKLEERIEARDQRIEALREQLAKAEDRADRMETALISRDGQQDGDSE